MLISFEHVSTSFCVLSSQKSWIMGGPNKHDGVDQMSTLSWQGSQAASPDPLVVVLGRLRGLVDKGAAANGATAVTGETETGMKMTVDTFLRRRRRPVLKKLDDVARQGHYPASTTGHGRQHRRQVPDQGGGHVRQGRERDRRGPGVETSFTCDLLRFEWVPLEGMEQCARPSRGRYCARTARRSRTWASSRGQQVYYVITTAVSVSAASISRGSSARATRVKTGRVRITGSNGARQYERRGPRLVSRLEWWLGAA